MRTLGDVLPTPPIPSPAFFGALHIQTVPDVLAGFPCHSLYLNSESVSTPLMVLGVLENEWNSLSVLSYLCDIVLRILSSALPSFLSAYPTLPFMSQPSIR